MSDGLISIVKWNYLGGHLQSSENLKLQIQLPTIETYYISFELCVKFWDIKEQDTFMLEVYLQFLMIVSLFVIFKIMEFPLLKIFKMSFVDKIHGRYGEGDLVSFFWHPFSFESSRNFCSITDTPTPSKKLIFVLFFFLSFKSNINRKKLTNRLEGAC